MRLDYSIVHPDWTKNIQPLSRSQKGEDVSLKWTFDNLGTTNKYYVEFGAIDGHQDCNTHYFREVEGWTGLLLESGKWFPVAPNEEINLRSKQYLKTTSLASSRSIMFPMSLTCYQ